MTGLALSLLLLGCEPPPLVEATCPGDDPTAGVSGCSAGGDHVLEGAPVIGDPSAGGQLSGPPTSPAGRPVPRVIALDFSGSMHGKYVEGGGAAADAACPYVWASPDFGRLLAAGPLATLEEGDDAWVALFNRDVALQGAGGAHTWYRGDGQFEGAFPPPARGAREVERLTRAAALGGVLPPSPYKLAWPDAAAHAGSPNDTDISQALDAAAAVFDGTAGQDGVLWLVTDNIVSTGTGPEPAKNAAFYRKIQQDPRWQVMLAWPVVRGAGLCGRAMMMYGMYYSRHELIGPAEYAALTRGPTAELSADGVVSGLAAFAAEGVKDGGHPLKLKPDYLDTLQVQFTEQLRCPHATPGAPRQCTGELQLTNLLKHRAVEGATVQLSGGRLEAWERGRAGAQRVPGVAPICAGQVGAEAVVGHIGPGETVKVPVSLAVPGVEVQSGGLALAWHNAQHEQFSMLGAVRATIRGLRTELALPHEQLRAVYGVGDLPEIFRNPRTDDLRADVCLRADVENPSYLASLLLLGGLGAAAALALGVGWLVRPAFRTVRLGGRVLGRVRLSRLGRSDVVADGRVVARVKLTAAGGVSVVGVPPYRAARAGDAWELRSGEHDTPLRLELLRVAPRAAGSGGGGGF